jgi:hypothetical protein
MLQRLLMGMAGIVLAMGLLVGTASATTATAGVAAVAQPGASSSLIEQVNHRHNWRPWRYSWRPWWYQPYYYKPCGSHYRCWRDRHGHRKCGWVNTCRRYY